jgi:2',3'-cyclic-nucleotide 2'-phosphodiesterase (5'-nucleotidase family)
MNGPLTYGRVFSALPFDNHFAVLKLTGAELTAMLETSFSGDHGILQFSGLKIEALPPGQAPCEPKGRRVLKVMTSDGKPVGPSTIYKVVTNDFVSSGGDGFDAILKNVDPLNNMVRNDLPPVREVIVSYFRLHPEIKGPDAVYGDRIHFVKPECAPEKSATP